MKRKFARGLLYALFAAALLYAADDLSLRYRIPNREPFGSITVQRYYALHKSKQKTNFMFADPETQTCVHSLFPHTPATRLAGT